MVILNQKNMFFCFMHERSYIFKKINTYCKMLTCKCIHCNSLLKLKSEMRQTVSPLDDKKFNFILSQNTEHKCIFLWVTNLYFYFLNI